MPPRSSKCISQVVVLARQAGFIARLRGLDAFDETRASKASGNVERSGSGTWFTCFTVA